MGKKRETRKPWVVFSITLGILLILGLASNPALNLHASDLNGVTASSSDAEENTSEDASSEEDDSEDVTTEKDNSEEDNSEDATTEKDNSEEDNSEDATTEATTTEDATTEDATTEATTTENATTEDVAVDTEVFGDDKAPNVSLPAQDALKNAVFTAEELASGEELEVYLWVFTEDMSSIMPEKAELIKKAAGNKTIGVLLDLYLDKWVGDEYTEISELNAPILITIDIPENLRQDGRKFTVIRLHDGVAVELADLDSNPNTITISTDRFSLYALAYEDVAAPAVNNTADSPKTGDNAPIAMVMILLCASGMLVVGLKKREMK